jgi:hypothetical protein
MVLLPDGPGVSETFSGESHAVIFLIFNETFVREDLEHLRDAGGGDAHISGQLGRLRGILSLRQSEYVDEIILAVPGGHPYGIPWRVDKS